MSATSDLQLFPKRHDAIDRREAHRTFGRLAGRVRHPGAMDIAVFVIAMVSALLTAAIVIGLFVWAAKKDGEEDREVQRRLGIRRRTWL
jgi:hypothetical protein